MKIYLDVCCLCKPFDDQTMKNPGMPCGAEELLEVPITKIVP